MFTWSYIDILCVYPCRYELEARGCTVQAECPIPTQFKSSDGRVHVLSNDRVDHVVSLNNEHALVEVKKNNISDSTRHDASQQVLRYYKNYCTMRRTDLYCVFFPKYHNKLPVVFRVDILTPEQRTRMNRLRTEAIEKRKQRGGDYHTNGA